MSNIGCAAHGFGRKGMVAFMKYMSTRNNKLAVESAYAIKKGISEDGGLFVPSEMPKIDRMDINELSVLSCNERAVKILSMFLTDFTEEELVEYVDKAYNKSKFDTASIAPIYELKKDTYMLELWHGPTCAFKDMALQILPHLLTASTRKTDENKTALILVATSGDTGKAALEGFKDVDGTKVMVFYPSEGVSNIQKLQMMTQEGKNVSVCAIDGNFDDAQSGVKKIFANKEFAAFCSDNDIVLSSANSINWGRLVPQVVYYISAYCDLVKCEKIKSGDKINICVPTGNFGNILAAYYAGKMGMPINRLICASNENNILTDFINTGEYDINRAFHMTVSPSMDILISSNLERLLFDLADKDDEVVKDLMKSLSEKGKYQIGDKMRKKLDANFTGGCCNDEETKETIGRIFREYAYLCDTHTAVAVNVYEKYLKAEKDNTPTLIVSTADSYKFANAVLESVLEESDKEEISSLNDFEIIEKLSWITKTNPPAQLSELSAKKIKFDKTVKVEEMTEAVKNEII